MPALLAVDLLIRRGGVRVVDGAVLLLDEPDDALDAAAIADLRALLLGWRDEGRTVLLSTHRTQALQVPFDGHLEVVERRVRHA